MTSGAVQTVSTFHENSLYVVAKRLATMIEAVSNEADEVVGGDGSSQVTRYDASVGGRVYCDFSRGDKYADFHGVCGESEK